MTVEQLLDNLAAHPLIIISYFAVLPLACLLFRLLAHLEP